VTDPKRERLEAEDRGWAELRALVDPLTPEQLTRDGYYEDWSAKDLLAHIGCWMAEASRILEQIRMGTFTGWDDDVDQVNARWYETWRDQDPRAVWAELHSARARVLEEWDRLPEVTDKADEWFRESGEDHYAEHLPRLRSWIEELRT
jgi:Mycothiol maleylpyruvate isomerase N-terminal domain